MSEIESIQGIGQRYIDSQGVVGTVLLDVSGDNIADLITFQVVKQDGQTFLSWHDLFIGSKDGGPLRSVESLEGYRLDEEAWTVKKPKQHPSFDISNFIRFQPSRMWRPLPLLASKSCGKEEIGVYWLRSANNRNKTIEEVLKTGTLKIEYQETHLLSTRFFLCVENRGGSLIFTARQQD